MAGILRTVPHGLGPGFGTVPNVARSRAVARARGRTIVCLEHFPTKWTPVGRRKCGKIKELEKRRDCSAIVPLLQHPGAWISFRAGPLILTRNGDGVATRGA
ncbi:hypothetical protein, partial [Methylobacterium aquaticum]|uniref:hypothetical protein n=1 Tax=Methylobacterium aquaticum TaxID=270351 RepID=UPI001AEBE2FD